MSIEKRPNALLQRLRLRTIAVNAQLFESLGVEIRKGIIFDGETYFYRMATDFAVFNVSLARHGSIEHHRDFFTAVRTIKRVFHIQTVQYLLSQ